MCFMRSLFEAGCYREGFAMRPAGKRASRGTWQGKHGDAEATVGRLFRLGSF